MRGDAPFFAYPKILERLDAESAAHKRLARLPWAVTEKIHGAHFTLVTDGKELRAGKRKEWLAPGEDFFGHRAVVARIEPAVRALFTRLAGAGLVKRRLAVDAELFGGAYPHPNVPSVPGAHAVQTGVWYSPGVELCVLDLSSWDEETPRFLDFELLLRECAAVGLLAPRPLLTGRLDEAQAFRIEFPSTVPSWFGLPALDDNLAEGVVLRPMREITVDTSRGPARPLFKRKIAAFAEDERYDGARKTVRSPGERAAALGRVLESAASLLTPARAQAAISKVGPLAQHRATIERALVDDLVETLAERVADDLAALSSDEKRILDEQLLFQARSLLDEP